MSSATEELSALAQSMQKLVEQFRLDEGAGNGGAVQPAAIAGQRQLSMLERAS